MIILKILKNVFTNKWLYYIIGTIILLWAIYVGLMVAWEKLAFRHPDVKKLKNDYYIGQLDLKSSQASNDSLKQVSIDCDSTIKSITETHQKNALDFIREKKAKDAEIKALKEQVNHFLEVAPCKKEVKIKDGNIFRKNKKEWVLIDCEQKE